MKKLYLLRHAKSSWEAADLADHDRPLGPRGERGALVVGRYILQRGFIPDLIICSTARRARETRDLAVGQWPAVPQTRYDHEIYLNGRRAILKRLSRVDRPVGSVLIVGHSPDLQDLTLALAAGGDVPLRRKAQEHFPTGTLAVFHLPIDAWSDILRSEGTLVELVTPKSLV